MAIPRLLGPALLTLAFYLWDAFHAATPARRRDARWIWQTVLLAVLGVVGRRPGTCCSGRRPPVRAAGASRLTAAPDRC